MSQYRRRAQRSIAGLHELVNWMAYIPGEKAVILTSAGFLSEDLQDQIEVIDRAVQTQTMISSLDPKGLVLFMPEVDSSLQGQPGMEDVMWRLHLSDTARDLAASSALSQLAEGSGGRYFRNNNDLKEGFARLSEQPISYTLAFRPTNLDGKSHKLEVKLVNSPHGGLVHARRSYLAIKTGSNRQAEQEKELQQMVASREEFQQLKIEVSTWIGPGSGETKELAVLISLDLGSVYFRKEGDRNVNSDVCGWDL
jgi:hypothetical protein